MSAATKRLRAQVFLRAEDKCESCGKYIAFDSGRMDHFFGRAKAEQALANCWALCIDCDTRKTVNAPSAAWWLGQFILHATRYGYSAEAERAGAKLQALQAKGLVAA